MAAAVSDNVANHEIIDSFLQGSYYSFELQHPPIDPLSDEDSASLQTNAIKKGHLEACYTFLLQHKAICIGPNDPQFKEDLASLQPHAKVLQDLIVKEIERLWDSVQDPDEQSSQIPDLSSRLEAALVLAWYQHWTRPKVKLAEAVTEIARLTKNLDLQAAGSFCLGKIYFRLDDYRAALRCFETARTSFVLIGNPLFALKSDLDLIDSLLWYGIDPSERLLTAVNELGLEINTPEAHTLLASHMANVQWYDSNHSAEVIARAQAASEQFFALKMPLEAADSLYRLARTYGVAKRYADGLEIIEQAIKVYDELGIGGRGLGVFVHIVKARYLKASDVWGPQLTHTLEIALEYAQQYAVPLATAQALEEWAEVYVTREDWDSARLAYGGALRQCEDIASGTGRVVTENCLNNLIYVRFRATGRVVDHSAFALPHRY